MATPTIHVTDLATGAMAVPPVNSTIAYTSITLQQTLQDAARGLGRQVARALWQVIE